VVAAVAAHRRIQELRELVASDRSPLSDIEDAEGGLLHKVACDWTVELPILQVRREAALRKDGSVEKLAARGLSVNAAAEEATSLTDAAVAL
jgi:hypothetical protein